MPDPENVAGLAPKAQPDDMQSAIVLLGELTRRWWATEMLGMRRTQLLAELKQVEAAIEKNAAAVRNP